MFIFSFTNFLVACVKLILFVHQSSVWNIQHMFLGHNTSKTFAICLTVISCMLFSLDIEIIWSTLGFLLCSPSYWESSTKTLWFSRGLQLRYWMKTGWLVTESSLSSWCKNWARSSGVVPSMPCSWRYWIPLFGFLLNLRRMQRRRTYCSRYSITVSTE